MKKSLGRAILSITSCLMAIILAVSLTGCQSRVSLQKAAAADQKITSCAYNFQFTANSKDAGNQSIAMSGKLSTTSDRLKLSGNFEMDMTGTKTEMPITVDTAKKGLDFKLSVGIPEALKSEASGMFDGKNTLYLDSKDLESFLKSTMTEDDYKKFQDALNNPSSAATAVVKDMQTSVMEYITKAKLMKLTAVKGQSISANGVFSCTLTKKEIKEIVAGYFNNKTYFSHFQKYIADMKNVASGSTLGMIESIDPGVSAGSGLDGFESDDPQKVIDSVNDALGTEDDIKLNLTLTVSDNYLTGIKVVISNPKDTGDTATFELILKDINKAVTINTPNKNDSSTYDIGSLLSQLASLSGAY